jgi:SanA protein
MWSNFSVYFESKNYISSKVDSLPEMKVGLLLGTSRYLGNDTPNAYFFNRIDAAVELYNLGKIKYVLVVIMEQSQTTNLKICVMN